MDNETLDWTKTELQVYILLMCANADKEETEEELDLIVNKVPKKLFMKIYREFHNDSEKKRLKKIDKNVHKHAFSLMELADFRKEVYELFLLDGSFTILEKRLDWTLDNILY